MKFVTSLLGLLFRRSSAPDDRGLADGVRTSALDILERPTKDKEVANRRASFKLIGNDMPIKEQQMHSAEGALRQFVAAIGFDADKIVDLLTDPANGTCKRLSLGGLKVMRDFTETSFTPAGVIEANKLLDSIQK
jgi:hypothetical protein